ncbi:hypothetical protein [Parvularcula sp. IMCC14364]|uniref:hypothetical protein n=1 Tax=Parvularcula sp. IMCC14364 TaxID=3067902 RepID=UPI0027415697|nr:hypothetical protein [Parvularcula sp. IMCC14364]
MKQRFEAREFVERGVGSEVYDLLSQVVSQEHIVLTIASLQDFRKFTIAIMLASHVSDHDMDQSGDYADFLSELGEEEWIFALSLCPYRKIDANLKNIDLSVKSLGQTYIGIVATQGL